MEERGESCNVMLFVRMALYTHAHTHTHSHMDTHSCIQVKSLYAGVDVRVYTMTGNNIAAGESFVRILRLKLHV